MSQASILDWVRIKEKQVKKVNKSNLTKRPPVRWAYRFLMDFPEGIMTPTGPAGPFRTGDLVSKNAMPPGIWAVLLKRGAVEPVQIFP